MFSQHFFFSAQLIGFISSSIKVRIAKTKLICVLALLLHCSFRISRPEVFCEKGVLKHFAKFPRKHLCHSLFFNKVAGLLWHRGFPVNFVKFLRTPFSQNTSGGCFICSFNYECDKLVSFFIRNMTLNRLSIPLNYTMEV